MGFNNQLLKKLFAAREILGIRLQEQTDYHDLMLVTERMSDFRAGVIYVGDASLFPGDLAGLPVCCLIIGNAAVRELPACPANYILLSGQCDPQTAYDRIAFTWSSYEYQASLDFSGRLKECGTIAEIIALVSRDMGCPVLLGDTDNRLLLCEGSAEIEEPLYGIWTKTGTVPEEICSAAEREGVSQRMEESDFPVYIGKGQFWRYNRILTLIHVEGHMAGILAVLETGAPFTFRDYNRVTAAGNAISENMRRAAGADGTAHRPEIGTIVYEQCFHSMLRSGEPDGRGPNGWLHFWIMYSGWCDRRFFRVCYIREPCPQLLPREETAIRAACPPDRTMMLPADGGLFCLTGTAKREQVDTAFSGLVSSLVPFGCRIFTGDMFREMEELAEQMKILAQTMRLYDQLGLQEKLCSAGEVQIYGLLSKIPPEDRLRMYRGSGLDRLREYDRRSGTEYYASLYAYLRCACDRSGMAQSLSIHRNTAAYRIGRIEDILEADLKDGETCLRLHLSFKIAELETGAHSLP